MLCKKTQDCHRIAASLTAIGLAVVATVVPKASSLAMWAIHLSVAITAIGDLIKVLV